MPLLTQALFKGIRNDMGQKFIPSDYFYNAYNVNYDNLVGADKILAPEILFNNDTQNNVNYIGEFRYTDDNNLAQSQELCIIGGTLYKNVLGTPVAIVSNMRDARATAVVFHNQLFIANGRDYPKIYDGQVVYEMGAPKAKESPNSGNPNGTYFYSMTYSTSGGEEIIGTISNTITVSSKQINLTIPIGYEGTTGRKIYRTVSNGNVPKLLATIADNTSTTYVDNVSDASLGADIGPVNNECPIVSFLEVLNECLVGSVSKGFPTNAWVTSPGNEVFDLVGNAYDISNIDGDNTPTTALSRDYSKVLIGTNRNIYILDINSDGDVSITASRAYVGVKSGYTMIRIPQEEDFDGGVFFVSTQNDVRLFNGNFEQPVPTSLDNLKTDNWAQEIRGTLNQDIQNANNLYAGYLNYKYHLIVGKKIYIFDIRVKGWAVYQIQTESYLPTYYCMGLLNNKLIIGQQAAGIVEQMYSLVRYRDEDMGMYFETQQVLASSEVKYIKDIQFFFVTPKNQELTLEIVLDGDLNRKIVKTFIIDGGSFLAPGFSPNGFDTVSNNEDYKIYHVNRWARWISIKISCRKGMFNFRGYEIQYGNNFAKSA